MKKFLVLASITLCLAICAPPIEAQTPLVASKTANTNADTSYVTFKMLPYFDQMSVQLIVSKTSGTVAGYIRPQYSLDGVNYINANDSLTVGNLTTQSNVWTYTGNSYLFYRYRYITSGTQVSALKGYYLTRTRPN